MRDLRFGCHRSLWVLCLAVTATGCPGSGEGAESTESTESATVTSNTAPASSSTASVDGTADTGGGAICNASIGLITPLVACSDAEPCENLGAAEDASVATTPTKIPTCITSDAARPAFDDSPPQSAEGIDGTTRYACEYRPPGTSSESPRPLVIWLHGAFGDADNLYNATSIRSKAESFDLSGDAARPGFILVSVQGRNTHWPREGSLDGSHHDIHHRELGAPSTNPDIANVDRIIDELVTEGVVLSDSIYLMGWSNGGFFAQLYAIARHETTTPGGSRVAAAAVYTAADPFHNIREDQSPSCRLDPYPSSNVPLFLISRACDIITCSELQAANFREDEDPVAPGYVVDTWVSDLQTRVGTTPSRRIIDGSGTIVEECTVPGLCLYSLAAINHVRWPDGVADKGGVDHEPEMLGFLANNRL